VIVLLLLFATGVLGGGGEGTSTSEVARVPGAPAPDADLVDFIGFVVDDVQTFWSQDFSQSGRTYQETKLVLFDGQSSQAAGSLRRRRAPSAASWITSSIWTWASSES
jgi:predicted metalloprotease